MGYLSIICVLLPVACGISIFIIRPSNKKTRNIYALLSACITSIVVITNCINVYLHGGSIIGFKITEALSFSLNPDGASLVFGMIIGILWPVTTVYAISYMDHEENLNLFYGFFLITYGVVAGIAFSGNLFTFYLFYEFMTLSTLMLVMHEMNGKARYAGKKYLIYSMIGAAMIFVAMIMLIKYGTTLDFTYGGFLNTDLVIGNETLLRIIFVLGFFGFGVKAAIFPLHDWLPSASVAPTPVTALLHAVAVVKAGAFGVMRLIYYCFGTELLFGSFAQNIVICVAAFTIAYGSVMALRSGHLKRRLAYSTVANLSYILLAFAIMTKESMVGGLLHMVFHAFIKITLFFTAGAVLHNNHLEYIDDMEGLSHKMPITCGVFTFMAVALMGVPPFGSFLSKWTIGSASASLHSVCGYIGAIGLFFSAVLTAIYMIPVAIRFFFPIEDKMAIQESYHEADKKMTIPMIALCIAVLLLSCFSNELFEIITQIGNAL